MDLRLLGNPFRLKQRIKNSLVLSRVFKDRETFKYRRTPDYEHARVEAGSGSRMDVFFSEKGCLLLASVAGLPPCDTRSIPKAYEIPLVENTAEGQACSLSAWFEGGNWACVTCEGALQSFEMEKLLEFVHPDPLIFARRLSKKIQVDIHPESLKAILESLHVTDEHLLSVEPNADAFSILGNLDEVFGGRTES